MNSIYMHEIMDCLVEVIEAKDFYTKGHSTRVADMSCDLAKEIGVSDEMYELIHLSAHLHDVGKVGVPDLVLNKKGSLTKEEFGKVKEHPVTGYNILMKSESLEEIAKVVRHHHERFDGKGYPDQLAGEAIPYASRLIAICDSIDAMVSDRPYRKALSWTVCIEEVMANKGLQFDPELVSQLHGLWPYWMKSGDKIITKYEII